MNALELVRRQLLRQQALKEAQKSQQLQPSATAATATSSRLLPDLVQHNVDQITLVITGVEDAQVGRSLGCGTYGKPPLVLVHKPIKKTLGERPSSDLPNRTSRTLSYRYTPSTSSTAYPCDPAQDHYGLPSTKTYAGRL